MKPCTALVFIIPISIIEVTCTCIVRLMGHQRPGQWTIITVLTGGALLGGFLICNDKVLAARWITLQEDAGGAPFEPCQPAVKHKHTVRQEPFPVGYKCICRASQPHNKPLILPPQPRPFSSSLSLPFLEEYYPSDIQLISCKHASVWVDFFLRIYLFFVNNWALVKPIVDIQTK